MSVDYDVTTVAGVENFPVENITHKPKRMQGDAIRAKMREQQRSNPTTHSNMPSNEPLTVVTLERAISYYEDRGKSSDPNSALFTATAKWLRTLLAVQNSQRVQAEQTIVANGGESDETSES